MMDKTTTTLNDLLSYVNAEIRWYEDQLRQREDDGICEGKATASMLQRWKERASALETAIKAIADLTTTKRDRASEEDTTP